MDSGANVGYLRQQRVLSGRTSMELPSLDLCTADIPLMFVSPLCPPPLHRLSVHGDRLVEYHPCLPRVPCLNGKVREPSLDSTSP